MSVVVIRPKAQAAENLAKPALRDKWIVASQRVAKEDRPVRFDGFLCAQPRSGKFRSEQTARAFFKLMLYINSFFGRLGQSLPKYRPLTHNVELIKSEGRQQRYLSSNSPERNLCRIRSKRILAAR